jgi:hypothetical protein
MAGFAISCVEAWDFAAGNNAATVLIFRTFVAVVNQ